MSIVTASIDNVRSELALTFEALLDHPDQWWALRKDPSLLTGAVEEGLRYVPAGDDIQHRVARDTDLGGVRFAEGTLLFIVKKAVNHDPGVFDDPHRFDIRREGPPHLTFGFGLHRAWGQRWPARPSAQDWRRSTSGSAAGNASGRASGHRWPRAGAGWAPARVTIEPRA